MFNEQLFRKIILEKGENMADAATVMEISKVTLYRKMSGKSDFFRAEIN